MDKSELIKSVKETIESLEKSYDDADSEQSKAIIRNKINELYDNLEFFKNLK